MGIDEGFDMVPRLTKGAVDRDNWKRFIDAVKEQYILDPQVEYKQNYILFKAGEHPMLPIEGHKLLRFSSKISGGNAERTGVERYISTVTKLAKQHFGSRVQHWCDAFDVYGTYSWDEVHDSWEAYELPDAPEAPRLIVSSTTGIDPARELACDNDVFELKDIPEKGKGLVAKVDIAKGTQILCEKPLFTARATVFSDVESLIAKKLGMLPKDAQRQFLSLHNQVPGKNPFTNIFKTNALPCGAGSVVGAVYPTICRINHSCFPNAHNNWDDSAEHETIYAIRPIKAGEEITIPYNEAGPSAERQLKLRNTFSFDCDCRGCTLGPAELHESDTRQLKIRELDAAIGDPMKMMSKPIDSLRNCRVLLRTLETEYDGHVEPHNARLYYDAFQICAAHGDQARASVFAEKAYRSIVICEGEDSPETQRVKALWRKPVSHASFGLCSKRWKTTKTVVPKGLDEAQFDEWLYRA